MKFTSVLPALLIAFLAQTPHSASAQTKEPMLPGKVQTAPIPDEFVDPETGLRVVHLSRFPNDYSGVIYFTYNTFSPDSRLTLIDAQYKDKWRYLYTFDFGSMAVKPLVTDRLTLNQVVSKSGNVYFLADRAIWVVPLRGGTRRKICDLPRNWESGIGFTVNANETLLLAGGDEIGSKGPNFLFTVNLKTGEIKVIHRDTHELGHVQFSPTDPDLCLFCHEGNWESVDRIWLINPSKSTTDADGKVTSNARIAFHRTEPREIAGHEFWYPDGKSIWFQHVYRERKPVEGFLTRLDIATGKTTNYIIPPEFNGIHQTWAPDGTFLISDGGGPKGDTKPGPAKYISKLTLPTDGSNVLKGERLVTLYNNDYAVEPNPHVSPDGRWVTFTATLPGTAQAYAVELPRKIPAGSAVGDRSTP